MLYLILAVLLAMLFGASVGYEVGVTKTRRQWKFFHRLGADVESNGDDLVTVAFVNISTKTAAKMTQAAHDAMKGKYDGTD